MKVEFVQILVFFTPNFIGNNDPLLSLFFFKQEYEVQADADFYKYILIRMSQRRCASQMWQLYEQTRNEVTYKSDVYPLLASACTTFDKCQLLLEDMKVSVISTCQSCLPSLS